MDYKRVPIITDKNTIMLLEIFTCKHKLEDIWKYEFIEDQTYNDYEKAAEQFVNQLEQHVCAAFLESLSLKLAQQYFKEYGKEHKKYWDAFITKINSIKDE